jgi:hypothetical protein
MFRYTYIASLVKCNCRSSHENEAALPKTGKSSNYRRAVAKYRTSSHSVLRSGCRDGSEIRSRTSGFEVDGNGPRALHVHIIQGSKSKWPVVVYILHEICWMYIQLQYTRILCIYYLFIYFIRITHFIIQVQVIFKKSPGSEQQLKWKF